MKTYLCIEDNEFFTIKAETLMQAREDAAIYNAQCIGEATPERLKLIGELS